MNLLTKSNFKLLKSKEYGYNSFGLHLAPHKLGGKNLCTTASAGCIASCLNKSGHGQSGRVQEARIKKTKVFNEDRKGFMTQLIKEVAAKVKSAAKTGAKTSFRLNLTSDVAWETIRIDGKNIMEMFPDVQFMDYTKNPARMLKFLQGEFPKNYHLTFSRSESNQSHVDIIMGCGGNVAVVFDKSLPKTYRGRKVISGDEHDLRFLDKKGVIVGLTAKGVGKKDKSGFVLNPKTGKEYGFSKKAVLARLRKEETK